MNRTSPFRQEYHLSIATLGYSSAELDKRDISRHNARMSHAQRAQTPDTICFVQAYAKINLTLDVLGRQADGYHALATVMQTIDLHDTICLTATDDDCVHMICTTPTLSNEENLAARAATMLRQRLARVDTRSR